ncbi:hypothetical protein Hdeb2414_s0006g00217491 [Helianthus debilis subsp. tardiflorus]
MPGAGTSTRASRKRGTDTRPRGDSVGRELEPVQQDEPEPVQVVQQLDSRRAIEYTGPGRSHGPRQRILDSPLLQFVQNSEEFRKLGALYMTELLPYRRIDWEVLDRLGARARVEQLLGPKFRKILDCDARQYKEITIEFHSTFDYKLGSFNKKGAVFFALGRKSYEMTVPEFAVATQFYTEEEVRAPEFINSLQGVVKKQRKFCVPKSELARFWSTISRVPYAFGAVACDITDPVLRYIHKILAATLVGRGEGDNKVNQVSLFFLMCMVEQRPVNLATVFAMSIKRLWRGGAGARIYCGPLITWLAKSLGMFERYPADKMKKGPDPCLMSVRDLQSAAIIARTDPITWEPIREGPQVQPPPGSGAAEAMQGAVPTRCQRPYVPRIRQDILARQYPLAQPRPDPLTLDSLYDSMQAGFDELRMFVDDQISRLRQEVLAEIVAGQRRLEDGMRAIMQGIRVQPPPSWQPSEAGPSGTHVGDEE